MAPEIANNYTYNLKADVYSFGVLLWEIVSLEIPFKDHSCDEVKKWVVTYGQRPKCDKSWPEGLQILIKECWDANFRKRPNFKEIEERLKVELEKLKAK